MTIVINETKLSIPKNIKKFCILKFYNKDDLTNTLIFTLYKLIKKIHYYDEFVTHEILKNNGEKYNFLLCLIYDNIPVQNIGDVAEKDLKDLSFYGYIKNEFKLKIIYLIPNFGTYNLNTYQKDIKIKMEEMQKESQKKMEELQNKMNNMEIKMKAMETIINKMKSQNPIEMEKMKKKPEPKMDELQKQSKAATAVPE